MSVYEQLQELLKSNQGELTTEQIADLVSKLTDMQKGDNYLALFRWQDKHRKENTNSKQEQLMNMLTFGVKQVNSTTIMDKSLPFEVKGTNLVNGCVV